MTSKGRKNKRDDPGSLEEEEELSDAKQSNMPASEAAENADTTKNSIEETDRLIEELDNLEQYDVKELTRNSRITRSWIMVGG